MISTVYYPNLFPSESWLRVAALCWDEVYTLHYQRNPQFPDEIANFNNQLGNFIIPRNTIELGRSPSVTQNFEEWLNTYSQEKIQPAGELIDEVGWYEMFGDKIPHRILEKLQSRSLVKPTGNSLREIDSSQQTINLPKEVAFHYMSLCAAKLAEEEKADLFAGKEVYAETAMFSKSVRGEITTSILEAYLPENLASMEMVQIKDLREELSEERLRFQGAINSLCDEFARVTSEEKLQAKQREIVGIAQERIELVRNTYRRANQSAVLTGLGMSLIPSSISAIASMLSVGVFLPAAILSTVATTSASILIQREKAVEEMKSSSWSYVLQIERKAA